MQSQIAELSAIVGSEHLLMQNQLAVRNPGWCSTSLNASCLVRPGSVGELSEVAKWANKYSKVLVPQGGLTGLVDGTGGKSDDVIVSTERLNRIVRVDPVQSVLIAEAGVTLQQAHDAAAEHGLTLGVDIPSRGSCTLGGIVSTNAGGIRVIRYGMTRENVLGLTAVLADGTIIDASNTLMKNNAGYDLKQLFIGTEGTLGMVTQVVFKLFPKPVAECTALVAVKSIDQLLGLLSQVRGSLGAQLLSFELMYSDYYKKVASHESLGNPPLSPEYPVYGIIESAERTQDTASSTLQQVLSIALEDELIIDCVIAQSEAERNSIWAIRERAEYSGAGYSDLASYDVGFELTDIGPFVSELRAKMAVSWPGKPVYVFGHLGDGNLHLCVPLTADEIDIASEISDIIYRITKKYSNSTVSAEHGIGTLKKSYLKYSRSDEQVALMQLLKASLDAKGMLNPRNIF